MIKKIFFTLLIILASSNISFAKSDAEVDGKNNNKIDAKNAKELTKHFGNNYNMYIQSHLKENCPSTISSKNVKKCETKTLKELYTKYGIVDIYNKLNNCDKVICSKEKKIFYDNLFRTKQIKLKKNQRLLLAQKEKLEEPDMDLIVNGDL